MDWACQKWCHRRYRPTLWAEYIITKCKYAGQGLHSVPGYSSTKLVLHLNLWALKVAALVCPSPATVLGLPALVDLLVPVGRLHPSCHHSWALCAVIVSFIVLLWQHVPPGHIFRWYRLSLGLGWKVTEIHTANAHLLGNKLMCLKSLWILLISSTLAHYITEVYWLCRI